MIRDRAHLADLIDRGWRAPASTGRSSSAATPRSRATIVDGLSLLREMAEIGHPLSEIGIPCYPQGHAFIADAPLLEALRAKAGVRQLHDDPAVLRPALDPVVVGRRVARRGSRCPSTSGCRASPSRRSCSRSARGSGSPTRIGSSSRTPQFIARLIRSGGFYRPDGLLEGLAPVIADPGERDRGPAPVHVQRGRRDRALAAGLPREARGAGRVTGRGTTVGRRAVRRRFPVPAVGGRGPRGRRPAGPGRGVDPGRWSSVT